jgi:hexosaminidase
MLKYPNLFGKGEIVRLSERVFKAFYRLIDELLELFCYSPYIHLGGDEAKISGWKTCKQSKRFIKEKGMQNEQEAYAYFVKRVTDYVLSKGKTPIVWEGFNKKYNHLISKNVIVIAWESYYQLAPDFLESGFKIINCSWKPLYIVTDRIRWTYKEILKWNKYTWDHFWEESPASKNKIIVDKNSCVLGAQLCAWGDVLVNYSSCEQASKNEFKIIRENLPALSQSCWAEDSGILEEDFLKIFNHTNKVLGKIL